MPKAVWNGAVLAASDSTEVVEDNHYFPLESLNREYFKESATTTVCPWKGTAHDVEVDGEVNKDAAWYYPEPKEAARQIAGHVAFRNGVEIQE